VFDDSQEGDEDGTSGYQQGTRTARVFSFYLIKLGDRYLHLWATATYFSPFSSSPSPASFCFLINHLLFFFVLQYIAVLGFFFNLWMRNVKL
jgi:hypothetical protein